jgi:hypothetical protein
MRSVERLHHFRCPGCDRWWTIGDAPDDRSRWCCPWCGAWHEHPLTPPPTLDCADPKKP